MKFNTLHKIKNNYQNLNLNDNDIDDIEEAIFDHQKTVERKIRKMQSLKIGETKKVSH